MYTYRLTSKAIKQFRKINITDRRRIFSKLDFYCSTTNPLLFAEPISGDDLGNWRFRIGDYRVIFDVADDCLKILKVGHRKDIYK